MAGALLTKKYAKTFYFASHFLPKDKKYAAYAVYAICRVSDEAVDGKTINNNTKSLDRIKENIDSAYGKGEIRNNVLLAFRDTVTKYDIPKYYFDQLIEGMRLDLNKKRYANFTELYEYCYKAAGVVGLILLKILGSYDAKTQEYSVNLGIAMQLTNILRDIKEDFQRGRIYLPQDEMEKCGVTESNISRMIVDDNLVNLLKFQIERAKEYYKSSSYGIATIGNLRCRFVAAIMKNMYAGILDSIENNGYDIFSRRAHVDLFKKITITLKTLLDTSA